MAHSYTRYTFNGSRTDYDLTFSGGFRVRNEVSAVKLGAPETPINFDWLSDTRVRINTSGLVSGDLIEFRRTVSKTSVPVNLLLPNNFTREAIVTAVTHTLQALQEVIDGRVDSFTGEFISRINEYILAAEDLKDQAESSATSAELDRIAVEAIKLSVVALEESTRVANESAIQSAISANKSAKEAKELLSSSVLIGDELIFNSQEQAGAATIPSATKTVSWLDGESKFTAIREIGAPLLKGGWKPANGVLDVRMTGSTSDIENDFPGLFNQAAVDATNNDWVLNVSQKVDKSPYVYDFLEHTLTGNLKVNFDSRAVLLPSVNHQYFVTNGSTGPFTITDFAYSQSVHGPLSAMRVTADGVETKLTQGVHFTVTGQVVNLTSNPPAGSFLVVSTSRYAVRFRSTVGSGQRVDITGVLNIDLNNSGYIIASGSGSGLGITNVDHWDIERIRVWSDYGYGSAPLDKRGDSAFCPLAFKTGRVGHIDARGMNDLALYASGSSSTDHDDDGGGLQVGSIYAERCSTVAKLARQTGHAHIGSIVSSDCATGFLIGVTDDDLPAGGGIHIDSINSVRMSRRVLDVRDVVEGGITVGSISVRDIGYLPGGTTIAETPAAVFLSGAKSVQVGYLDVRWRDWTVPAGFPAVQLSGVNHGNRINGGWVERAVYGIRETGSAINHTGNVFTLTMKDVTTPFVSAGTSQSVYDLTVLVETSGVVSTKRVMSSNRSTATPTLLLAGATSSPSYSYTFQDLSYQVQNSVAKFWLRVQGVITHSESTGRPLRIVLPSSLVNSMPFSVPVTLGRVSGLSIPVDNVYAEIPPGFSYIRFYHIPSGGGDPVEITAQHVATGVNIRFEISGDLPV